MNLLDEALCENTPSTICRKCRYKLLRLKKLKKEYEEVKGNLKTQLQACQLPQRRQVLRTRSWLAESTGVSPAAKRTYRSVSAARKELFPTVDPTPTDVTARLSLYLRSPQHAQGHRSQYTLVITTSNYEYY